MNALPPNEGRSWWLREALAQPEFAGEPCPPLDTDTKADVVILGGGYTGMWTAWFLKELDPGLDVVLLEQDICGGGPSGRNGGFVNSFWDALDFLAERFGDAPALRICRAGQESVDGIGRFCEEHDIDAWFAEIDKRGARLIGDQLESPEKARTVRVRGDAIVATDGPFAETKELVAGFDVLECDDLDTAVELAALHPVARFGAIEVRQFWNG